MGHWIEAVTLGVVQGLTEFLPISSSAHLDIMPKLIGWHKPGAQFTAVTQLGTMSAVMVYFRKGIIDTIGGMFKSLAKGGDKMSSQARLFYAVIIGTIPIGVIGLLLKKFIEKDLHNLYINATMLVVMGLLMGLAERMTNPRRDGKDIQNKDGIIVGYILIELKLKKLIPNSVYPELLVDSRFEQEMPRSYSYAIYRDHKMLYS